MTNEEFVRALNARNPKGWGADEAVVYATELINRLEGSLHTSQAQITAAREAQTDAERRYGSELITRQRMELELAKLKEGGADHG